GWRGGTACVREEGRERERGDVAELDEINSLSCKLCFATPSRREGSSRVIIIAGGKQCCTHSCRLFSVLVEAPTSATCVTPYCYCGFTRRSGEWAGGACWYRVS
ncbi:unnamed protein product, partial [Ectocarpus fasciculatus]